MGDAGSSSAGVWKSFVVKTSWCVSAGSRYSLFLFIVSHYFIYFALINTLTSSCVREIGWLGSVQQSRSHFVPLYTPYLSWHCTSHIGTDSQLYQKVFEYGFNNSQTCEAVRRFSGSLSNVALTTSANSLLDVGMSVRLP